MKLRSDFISNSSSSSFIISDEATKNKFNELFPNYKMFKINDLIYKFNNMLSDLMEYQIYLENDIGSRYETCRIFDDIYYDIDSLCETVKETLKYLKEINENTGLNTYITEPVDRDRAYKLHFSAPIFKGDL